MERIPDIDQERIDYWRQINHDLAPSEDTDLPADQQRDRAEVIPGSNLKRDDDILIWDSIPLRIIGPGRGTDVVLAYYPPWFGDYAMTFELNPHESVTQRAPFDTEEEPMPIFIEPLARSAQAAQPAEATKEGKHGKEKRLKEFLKAQPPETQKQLKKALHKHGLLSDAA